MAPKRSARQTRSPSLKAKCKADPEVAFRKKRDEIEAKLTEALEAVFSYFDADKDGRVERIEFLDGLEVEACLLGKICGTKEKREAMVWFKEIAEGTPQDGMYAGKDPFVAGRRAAYAAISGEEPGTEAHLSWVCDLARKWHNRLHPPVEEQKAPNYPIKIGLKAMDNAIQTAYSFGKVPLIVCNSSIQPKNFLMYSSYSGPTVDCKRLVAEVFALKTKSMEDARDELKTTLLGAMETLGGGGKTLQIQMGNSACDFKNKFCCPGQFPDCIFGGASEWNETELRKHFPNPMTMIQPGFHVLVCTDFSLAEAMQYLPPVLPYFDTMAIIEIEPP